MSRARDRSTAGKRSQSQLVNHTTRRTWLDRRKTWTRGSPPKMLTKPVIPSNRRRSLARAAWSRCSAASSFATISSMSPFYPWDRSATTVPLRSTPAPRSRVPSSAISGQGVEPELDVDQQDLDSCSRCPQPDGAYLAWRSRYLPLPGPVKRGATNHPRSWLASHDAHPADGCGSDGCAVDRCGSSRPPAKRPGRARRC